MNEQLTAGADNAAGRGRRWSRMSKKKKVGALVLLMVLSAVAAFAYWSTLGSGSANTEASSNVNSTVTAAITPGVDSGLWPGNPTPVDLHFTVNNPNPYNITFTTATVGAVTGSGGCLASEFEATAGSITLSAPLFVAAGETAEVGTVPGALKLLNLAENQDDCQGASISTAVTLTGTQDQP